MIISSTSLQLQLDSIAFPTPVYAHNSGRVVMSADRDDLSFLISKGMVFGIGSRHRIRRVQLHPEPVTPPTVLDDQLPSSNRVPVAADDRTVERQTILCGFVYRHHPSRCNAFSAGRTPIDGSRL